MIRKQYIKPEVTEIRIETQSMLAASGDRLKVGFNKNQNWDDDEDGEYAY
ncbi:MAG: hypothetical protein IJ710_02975 [Prevotella sp.]|nr:hypothetical protein [Prevotella sp.]